jgi:hypothetical protein
MRSEDIFDSKFDNFILPVERVGPADYDFDIYMCDCEKVKWIIHDDEIIQTLLCNGDIIKLNYSNDATYFKTILLNQYNYEIEKAIQYEEYEKIPDLKKTINLINDM